MMTMNRALRLALLPLLLAGLAGCSFFSRGPEKPRPAELQQNPALLGVRQAWSAHVGAVALL